MNSNEITREQLAGMIDHTFLKAYATKKDFEKLCGEARENGFAMVAINSYPVKMCKELLEGCKVHVGAAISFPLGQTTIETKAFETEQAIKEGADEIDYVIDVGQAKMHNWDYIQKEMDQLTQLCHDHQVKIKVIFENCYLEKDEIKKLSEIAKEVKPDFIKTSTGFGTGGATVEDVKLMKETVGDLVEVKAAGGIRDWNTCQAMLEAGATRIGISASKAVLDEIQ